MIAEAEASLQADRHVAQMSRVKELLVKRDAYKARAKKEEEYAQQMQEEAERIADLSPEEFAMEGNKNRGDLEVNI
jgi:hypothetical protein